MTRFFRSLLDRPLLFAAAVCFSAPALATAQQRPTAAQAQELLRQRPDLATQLQQRLRTSGLTPDQLRARLRAEGYPESLLDAYLPGGTPRSASDTTSTSTVLEAVRSLGIVDSADVEVLRAAAGLAILDDTLTVGGDSLSGRPRSDRPTDRRPDGLTRADSLAAARTDSGFEIFGRDVFQSRTSQFDPNLNGPVGPNYRLGPGDRLVLILTGDVEQAYQLDVTREGFVVVPQVGQLYVANLTLDQLNDLLYTRLGRVYSGVRRGGGTTQFSVSVGRLRANQVFVFGDVVRPNSYRVSSAGTVLSALYAAGGPTASGSLRRVLLRRGGRVVDTLDVYDYLINGDATRDPRLESGDVVFVPPQLGRVRVAGAVNRPATYELRPGETLADVIRNAGGLEATASQRRIQIERVLPAAERSEPGRDRSVVDVTTPAPGAPLPRVTVVAGDVIRVFDVATRVRDRVVVLGNVYTPGAQGIRPGARLSDALRNAGGLKPDTYLGEVLVTRLRSDSSRTQLRARLADSTGRVLNDLVLQEDDEIRVFAVTEFRPTRYVAITGAVRRGGQFRYRDGMTLRDLVLLAGGLDESALLNEAEIARLPENRANGVTARAFRVALDSSYLFERAPDGRYSGPPGIPAPAGTAPELSLVAYDNVLIFRQPDFALQRAVFIGGEVRFPGRYVLRTKSERLVDVVQRAGGFTSEASAEGVEFYRLRGRVGRVGIDLPGAMRDARNRDNLVLVDGDSIIIPQFNAVVTVSGAVNQASALTYMPGRNIDYYIRAAGGGNARADLGRAYVIQPNGRLESVQRRRLRPDGTPTPRPGARVIVPERSPDDRRDFTQAITLFAQVGGAIATLIAAVVALRR